MSTFYLSRLLARAGFGSRRSVCRQLLAAGRVTLDQQIIYENVALETSQIRNVQVDGSDIEQWLEPPRIWLFNKPRGTLVTEHDPQNRKQTIFQYISERYSSLPRLTAVGRLDLNSQGLMILTNSGALANYFERTAMKRQYKVRAYGRSPSDQKLQKLEQGATYRGVTYSPLSVTRLKQVNPELCWYNVVLNEGKNREIRRIFAMLNNLAVDIIYRDEYGPFSLDNYSTLATGELQEVDASPSIQQYLIHSRADKPTEMQSSIEQSDHDNQLFHDSSSDALERAIMEISPSSNKTE